MRARRLVVALTIVPLIVSISVTASATVPGQNGRIAFWNYVAGPSGIWMINPDGGGRHELSVHGREVRRAAWSPDGTRLAIASTRPGRTRTRLQIVSPAGKIVRTLLTGRSIKGITWSPNGLRLAFCRGNRRTRLLVVRRDGTALHRIGRRGDCDPAWSPKGAWIAADHTKGFTEHTIVRMRPNGAGRRVIAHNAIGADWAPSGDRIIFYRDRHHQSDLFTMNPDGSGVDRLTNTAANEGTPVWSPDGKWVAYSRWPSTGPIAIGDLWLMRVVNGQTSRLTDTPHIDEWDPQWQPI